MPNHTSCGRPPTSTSRQPHLKAVHLGEQGRQEPQAHLPAALGVLRRSSARQSVRFVQKHDAGDRQTGLLECVPQEHLPFAQVLQRRYARQSRASTVMSHALSVAKKLMLVGNRRF